MAKRNGRNQRRRHREMIAAQEAKISELHVSVRRAKDDLAVLLESYHSVVLCIKEWDRDISRLLGEYTAFRIEKGRMTGEVPPYRINIPQDLPAYSITTKNCQVSAEKIRYYIAVLYRQLVDVEPDYRQGLKNLIRLAHVDAMGNEILHLCYEVEGRTLMRMGVRDRTEFINSLAQIFYDKANRS